MPCLITRIATDPRPLRDAVESLLVTLLTSTGDRRPDRSLLASAQLDAVLRGEGVPGDGRATRARAAALHALDRLTVADHHGARSELITARRLLLDTGERAAGRGKHRPVRAV